MFRATTIFWLSLLNQDVLGSLKALPGGVSRITEPIAYRWLYETQYIFQYIWILVHNTLCNINAALQEHFSIVLNVLSLILMISSKNCHTFQLPCNTADTHPGLLQLQRAYFNSWIV